MWVLTLLLVYTSGALGGWFIELLYRSYKMKHLVNPGFLNGPYLPMYGFGTVFLYLISTIEVDLLLKIGLFALGTTVLELITGIIFTEFFNIRLWDYSKEPLNFKGQICLRFSIYWTLLSILFYFIAYPFIEDLARLYQDHIWTSLFVGLFYGVFLTDVYNQFSLAFRIRKAVRTFNKEYLIRFRMDMKTLRREMRSHLKENKLANSIERYFIPFNRISHGDLIDRFNDQVRSYMDNLNNDIKKKGSEFKEKMREDLMKIEDKVR